MTESEKVINSISPYLNKVIDNGYLVDRSVIVSELFSNKMYVPAYSEYIYWITLNQRKYNTKKLSIKELIMLLSIDIKNHIMIFHKDNNVYCCCDFTHSMYSRSSSKRFLFLFNLLDQSDMIILFIYDDLDRCEIIKDNVFFSKIYEAIQKKLKDVEYCHIVIKPTIFNGCNIFCDNILYLLYYTFLEKHAQNEGTDSLKFKIEKCENSLGRVFQQLQRLFKVVAKRCSYYHDTISQDDLIEYQINTNLENLKIELEYHNKRILMDAIYDIKSQSAQG